MEILKNEIVSLLKEDNIRHPGAIVINGEWGVGKTYFWKEHVVPCLGNKKVVYMSLATAKDSEAIYRKIALALMSDKLKELTWKDVCNWFYKFKDVTLGQIGAFVCLIPLRVARLIAKIFSSSRFNDITFGVQDLNLLMGSIDFFQSISKEVIICFDDVERAGVQILKEDLINVCIGLIELKEAKVVLIMNENKSILQSEFQIHREKLVWKTFKYNPDMHELFEVFSSKYLNKPWRSKLRQMKDEVLVPFEKEGRNLRVLAKLFSDLNKVLPETNDQFTSDQIRFYGSLCIWQSQNKPMDLEIFENLAAIPFSMKKDDQNEMQISAREFANMFYKDTMLIHGYSKAMYNYLMKGIVEKSLFQEEFFGKVGDPMNIFLNRLRSEWFYNLDINNKKALKDFESLLISKESQPSMGTIIETASIIKRLSIISKIPFPCDLQNKIEKKIKERLDINEKMNNSHLNHLEEDTQDVITYRQNLESYAKSLIKENKVIELKENLINEINNLDLSSRTYFNAFDEDLLVKALTSDEVLDALEKIPESNPGRYYTIFYQGIDYIQRQNQKDVNYEMQKKFIASHKKWIPEDNAGKMRKRYIDQRMEIYFKPADAEPAPESV